MWELIIPSFIAGLLTFLAPCTLPLVPSFLGFISGISLNKDSLKQSNTKYRIVLNSLLYVLGFSFIFIILGTAFAWGGTWLTPHRLTIARLGGIFIIFFGLLMLHAFNWRWLNFFYQEKRLPIIHHLKPGQPLSSFLFGSLFAFGWSPCIGPILATVLFLATTTHPWQGMLLLSVFSLGMGLPFILIALAADKSLTLLPKLNKYLPIISTIGGIFLILIGLSILTNTFSWFTAWFYQLFNFINYDKLLNYF